MPLSLSLGTLSLLTAASWLGVVLLARLLRSRIFAIFVGVLLGVISLIWRGLLPTLPHWAQLPFLVLQGLLVLHLALLARPRLRPLWFRALISVPALTFAAGTMLALPWAIVAALGFTPYGWFLPYGLALIGLWQSLRNPRRAVDVVLDGASVPELVRYRSAPPNEGASRERPLTIAQITDPHLGPFMSPARLRGICARAAAERPDLVLITGDLLTMESQRSVDALAHALEPLAAKELEGRVFACYGNHDHEARQTVNQALERVGARLLVDESTLVDTELGPVEIVGADFRFRGREEQLQALFSRLGPRRPGLPRILMLHDPGAFRLVPEGAAELTLSGHTHGGQLGLVSLGLSWTIVALSKIPDHGLWARGRGRLYVHRGTGHYGFPLRVGVPGEEGALRVWGLGAVAGQAAALGCSES